MKKTSAQNNEAEIYQQKGSIESTGPEFFEVIGNVLKSVNLAFYRGFSDWSVIFFGNSIKHITGYEAEKFINKEKNWMDIVYPEDRDKISKILKEALSHQKNTFFRTYRIITAYGEIKWISDRGKIVYDSRGKFLWLDGLILDVTKEKNLEQILEKGKKDWELTFDSIPNLIVISDLDNGSCIYSRVNKAFAGKFGLHPRDIIKKSCKDLLKDASLPCRILNPLDLKEPVHRDIEISGLGGYFHIISVPVINEQREVERIICIFTDITAVKEAEKRLTNLTRELSFIIDAVSVLVIGIDEKGHIYRWNRVAEKVFSIPATEVLNRPITQLALPGDFISRVIPAYKQCLETKETLYIPETRFYTGEGTKLLDLTVRPFFTAHNLLYVFITGFDVTERKKLEMMLVHAQKLESIGALAAGIAHEINTPCQCILSNLNFVMEELNRLLELAEICEDIKKSDSRGREQIEKLKRAAADVDIPFLTEEIPEALNQSMDCLNRVIRIVESVREFSHPGAQDKMAVDIHRLIQSTVEISKNEWKYVADIEFDFDYEIPPVICYPNELSQVLLNIVVNAAQAIKESIGERPESKGVITIRTRKKDPSWCEISVTDTGLGIPKEIRHKIFEPFFTTKPVGKGTGQGLAIAQAIIMKKHNGHIYFETEEGKGTTFFILIPIEEKFGTNGYITL